MKTIAGRDMTAATARAEAIAHLRRYENQYLEFWDGTDDRGQGQHSFSDYLARIAQPAAWGGLLEIKALTRTAKCNILILPEDASMSACAFASGDSRPNIVLCTPRITMTCCCQQQETPIQVSCWT